jgi:2-polyprenyl-3-methyl-5-hydroxy-6-metoxy-1,4-benzoquinol methylase
MSNPDEEAKIRMAFQWLKQRQREPEVMDDPDLDPRRHAMALRGLSRLNSLSGSVGIIWPPILRLARQLKLTELRVLDVATGAGDIPLGLWQKAHRADLNLEVHGVDISPTAIAFARKRAAEIGAPVTFSDLDVLSSELPHGYDVVISSLFFHHLDDPQAIALMRSMAAAAERLVVVSDLRRNLGGWMLAHAASRLLTRSDVVHTDAALSVKGAYTMDEFRALAVSAGLDPITIRRCWPCRQLLTALKSPHP